MKNLTARLLARFSFLTLEVLLVSVVFSASLLLFFYLTRVVFVAHSAQFDDWGFRQLDALRAIWPGLRPAVRFVTFFASLPFLVVAGMLGPLLPRWRGRLDQGARAPVSR